MRFAEIPGMMAEATKRRAGGTEPADRAVQPSALRGVCVLVVDDDPDTRAILQMWFEYLGCVVVTAESADEALFLSPRVLPDLVLTDISMPARDGYWLLRELRAVEQAAERSTPVVAMTAFGAMQKVPLAVSADFDDWVPKPISFPDLGALVQKLTRRRLAA